MNVSPRSSALEVDESWIFVSQSKNKAPKNAVPFSRISSFFDQALSASSHKVYKMLYLDEQQTFQAVYFKKCDASYPSILAQIEAAASSACRLVRGENAAKILPVVDENHIVIGSISFELPNLRTFSACVLTVEDLIRYNAAEAWVNRYVREDDDYHPDNGGVIDDRVCGDFDFDMFYYPVTSKIKGPRFVNNGFFAPHPENAFPYTISDLEEFPNIKHQVPCHWPAKRPSNNNMLRDWKQRSLFQTELPNNKEFEYQKWTAFLKEAMIDGDMQAAAVMPNFSNDGEGREMFQRLLAHMNKRHDDLAKILPHSPKFRKFLIKNSGIFLIIDQTFQKNVPLYENHQAKIKQRFFSLVRKCMVKDLTTVLFNIGALLNSDKSEVAKEPYYRLLGHVQELQEDSRSFESSLYQLEMGVHSLSSFFTENVSKQFSQDFEKFLLYINNYRRFCAEPVEPPESSSLKIHNFPPPVPVNASKVIAKEICEWLTAPEHMINTLAIVKECFSEYAPLFGSWNPRSYFRARTSAIDTLIQEIETNQENPGKVITAILEFLKQGAWNQSGFVTGASANVLLIDKLANAALEDFTSMLYPSLLRNHDLVQVCFLIKNNKWKIIDHVQAIATEMKILQMQSAS